METEHIPYFHSSFLEGKKNKSHLLDFASRSTRSVWYQAQVLLRLAAAILKILDSLADGRIWNVLVAPGPWQFMQCNGPTDQPSWLSGGFTFLSALTDKLPCNPPHITVDLFKLCMPGPPGKMVVFGWCGLRLQSSNWSALSKSR